MSSRAIRLPGSHVRGLRPRRRRAHHRRGDRQPDAHRRRRPRTRCRALGGNLGTTNSVAWMFEKKGQIYIDATQHRRGRDAWSARSRPAPRTSGARTSVYVVTTRPTTSTRCRRALEAKRHRSRRGRARDGAEEHRAGRRARRRRVAAQADRGARGARRRAEGLGELRHRRRRDGGGRSLTTDQAARVLVLGIDPGTATTGYGVVRGDGPGVRLARRVRRDPHARARSAAGAPARDLRRHRRSSSRGTSPTRSAVEDVFYAKNVRTTVVLGHARGVILLAGAQHGLRRARVSRRPRSRRRSSAPARRRRSRCSSCSRDCCASRASPQPSDAADGVAAALACLMGAACAHRRRRPSARAVAPDALVTTDSRPQHAP